VAADRVLGAGAAVVAIGVRGEHARLAAELHIGWVRRPRRHAGGIGAALQSRVEGRHKAEESSELRAGARGSAAARREGAAKNLTLSFCGQSLSRALLGVDAGGEGRRSHDLLWPWRWRGIGRSLELGEEFGQAAPGHKPGHEAGHEIIHRRSVRHRLVHRRQLTQQRLSTNEEGGPFPLHVVACVRVDVLAEQREERLVVALGAVPDHFARDREAPTLWEHERHALGLGVRRLDVLGVELEGGLTLLRLRLVVDVRLEPANAPPPGPARRTRRALVACAREVGVADDVIGAQNVVHVVRTVALRYLHGGREDTVRAAQHRREVLGEAVASHKVAAAGAMAVGAEGLHARLGEDGPVGQVVIVLDHVMKVRDEGATDVRELGVVRQRRRRLGVLALAVHERARSGLREDGFLSQPRQILRVAQLPSRCDPQEALWAQRNHTHALNTKECGGWACGHGPTGHQARLGWVLASAREPARRPKGAVGSTVFQ
jgi:hypothetical protein